MYSGYFMKNTGRLGTRHIRIIPLRETKKALEYTGIKNPVEN